MTQVAVPRQVNRRLLSWADSPLDCKLALSK